MMQNCPEYVKEVLQTLCGAGYRPYLVGGCVRDLLRGAEPADYDLTSDARPEEVMALFGAAAHPTGLAHGTVTVVSAGHPVELTTMRRDGAYRDCRRPESVTFTTRIEDDLARRDFTVNAMALSPEGALIDPFSGEADLRAGLLRCVGIPEQRFSEDALRILRLLRFSSKLGFSVDADTARAAYDCRALLSTVAHERVYAELTGLLLGEGVCAVLLRCPEILTVVLPELAPCVGFDQRNHHHSFDVWEHTARSVAAAPLEPILRWTMLFHDIGKPECFTVGEDGEGHFYGHTARSAAMAAGIMERLRFEKSLRNAVSAQLVCFDDVFPLTRAGMHREMAKRGRETTRRLLCTKRADQAAKSSVSAAEAEEEYCKAKTLYDMLCAEGACCTVSELAISGAELSALGFRGRTIGMTLQKLLDEVAREKLPNTRDALHTRAARLYRSGFGCAERGNKEETNG